MKKTTRICINLPNIRGKKAKTILSSLESGDTIAAFTLSLVFNKICLSSQRMPDSFYLITESSEIYLKKK